MQQLEFMWMIRTERITENFVSFFLLILTDKSDIDNLYLEIEEFECFGSHLFYSLLWSESILFTFTAFCILSQIWCSKKQHWSENIDIWKYEYRISHKKKIC